MTFDEWLKREKRERGRTALTVAKDLGVNKGTVVALRKGAQRPSVDLVIRIHRLTDGDVNLLDWEPVSSGDRR